MYISNFLVILSLSRAANPSRYIVVKCDGSAYNADVDVDPELLPCVRHVLSQTFLLIQLQDVASSETMATTKYWRTVSLGLAKNNKIFSK